MVLSPKHKLRERHWWSFSVPLHNLMKLFFVRPITLNYFMTNPLIFQLKEDCYRILLECNYTPATLLYLAILFVPRCNMQLLYIPKCIIIISFGLSVGTNLTLAHTLWLWQLKYVSLVSFIVKCWKSNKCSSKNIQNAVYYCLHALST